MLLWSESIEQILYVVKLTFIKKKHVTTQTNNNRDGS